MNDLDRDNLNESIKTHDEILSLIKDIKGFEEKYPEYEITEIITSDEYIDVENQIEETKIPISKEIKKQKGLKSNLKKFKIFRVKFSYKPKQKKKSNIKESASFTLRVNEHGRLVNLDFNKPEQKKETKNKIALKFMQLVKFKRKGKDKGIKEENTEAKESKDKSKKSKLKDKLGKLSKLKKAIPSKKEKSKEKTESE